MTLLLVVTLTCEQHDACLSKKKKKIRCIKGNVFFMPFFNAQHGTAAQQDVTC